MRLIESHRVFLFHGVERLDLLRQGGSFVPNNSTAVQHFLTCYGVALDEVILLYLSNTFWGIISGDGADAASRRSADPQIRFQ